MSSRPRAKPTYLCLPSRLCLWYHPGPMRSVPYECRIFEFVVHPPVNVECRIHRFRTPHPPSSNWAGSVAHRRGAPQRGRPILSNGSIMPYCCTFEACRLPHMNDVHIIFLNCRLAGGVQGPLDYRVRAGDCLNDPEIQCLVRDAIRSKKDND